MVRPEKATLGLIMDDDKSCCEKFVFTSLLRRARKCPSEVET